MKIKIDIPFKHFFQKLFRGYSDAELWDLGDTFYLWLYPRLKAYRRMKRHGVPVSFTSASWEAFLKRSQQALERYLGESGYHGFKKPLQYDYQETAAELKDLLAHIDDLWD